MLVQAARRLIVFPFLLLLLCVSQGPAEAQTGARLTFQDLMKVRQVRQPSISSDGQWIALTAAPDRGDGEVLVYETAGGTQYSVPQGSGPVFSADALWVAMRLDLSFEDQETAEGDDRPRPGAAVLDTRSGEVLNWEDIQSFAFSGDGRWMGRLQFPPRGEEDSDPEGGGEDEGARTRSDPGTTLVLREMNSGAEEEVEHVSRFSFDSEGRWVAFVTARPDGEGDGIHVRRLVPGAETEALETGLFAHVETMEWWSEGTLLAWVLSPENENGEAGPGTLSFWDGTEVQMALDTEGLTEGWVLPARNNLQWSETGDQLFFGSRPRNQVEEDWSAESEGEEEGEDAFDPFDFETILEGRGVDVWHTDDPLINSNQKQVWNRTQTRLFTGVYHRTQDRAVQLGDTLVQLRGVPDNSSWALATSDLPYLKEQTWTGGADDLYLVSLDSGDRVPVATGIGGGGSAANSWVGVSGPSLALSPGGRFVVWFNEDHWHLFDVETRETRVLTTGLNEAFFDVDHDFPNPRGGHGLGGWVEGDEAVLVHDKYDVWRIPTAGGQPLNLTGGEGRSGGLILRVLQVDPNRTAYSNSDPIYLASFQEADKGFGFYRTHVSGGGLEPLLDEDTRVRVLAKAEEADRILFTQEDYDEFPDLWVSDLNFGDRRKVSDVNPGLLERFAWGTSELIEWTSDDGVPLQGVLIKPGNYEPGKRYPVLTYFYRFFSQRLHEFNAPVINHRPSFPIYASDGYLVFLPDVRFEVGRPGISSLKSVVPGLKQLVEMGFADPNALGLHGHSWSGYTTAYMVTQTNLFAAAVAGAPVSNMTSAYGGIRWGTGLARQFQYEMTQSRLSGSLWDDRYQYIENSPLFYADRVETPIVLMHGDEDDAVPWYQSIEFYLALRRTGKQAVFLQYRGEPHHPQRYGNKLDYSIKMKEFFDHYLKGARAPDWWTVGVPYSGR